MPTKRPPRREAHMTTRSSSSRDGHRDFDGFDVELELQRLRANLDTADDKKQQRGIRDLALVTSATAARNIDEWMCRGGSMPFAWRAARAEAEAERRERDPNPSKRISKAKAGRALRTAKTLLKGYAEQLSDVGKILVRAKVITAAEVKRQGVRFAVSDHFEPRPPGQAAAKSLKVRRSKGHKTKRRGATRPKGPHKLVHGRNGAPRLVPA